VTWKRLGAGEIARCRCGRTTFVEVGKARVLWFANLPNNTPVPSGCDIYRCSRPGCDGHRRYLAVGIEESRAFGPPMVAA
jgi:hypothetical protein